MLQTISSFLLDIAVCDGMDWALEPTSGWTFFYSVFPDMLYTWYAQVIMSPFLLLIMIRRCYNVSHHLSRTQTSRS